ncbi:MAG: DUF1838 family protein [Gammaproteobacteria bacterium]|jgi:hypothetical protein|nr:DUF1838 family protein [Gammaproteobacteria bacterium]
MSKKFDFKNQKDLLNAQVKLRGSLDGAAVFWFMRGTQYGVVDLEPTPFYNLCNGSYQRITQIDDDVYQITMLELSYFTDLKTGEPLREFTNPYNGETCQMPEEIFGPNKVGLTLEGLQPPEQFPFGTLTFDGDLGPAYALGDDFWIREETKVRMLSKNPAFGDYLYNEIVNYHGSLKDISDPAIANASATINYHTTSNFRPWMKMGRIVGNLESQATGKKIVSLENFPADYLQLAQQHHPEFISDPIAVLDAPPKLPSEH